MVITVIPLQSFTIKNNVTRHPAEFTFSLLPQKPELRDWQETMM